MLNETIFKATSRSWWCENLILTFTSSIIALELLLYCSLFKFRRVYYMHCLEVHRRKIGNPCQLNFQSEPYQCISINFLAFIAQFSQKSRDWQACRNSHDTCDAVTVVTLFTSGRIVLRPLLNRTTCVTIMSRLSSQTSIEPYFVIGVVNVLSNIAIFFSSQTVHSWKLPTPPI